MHISYFFNCFDEFKIYLIDATVRGFFDRYMHSKYVFPFGAIKTNVGVPLAIPHSRSQIVSINPRFVLYRSIPRSSHQSDDPI